MNLTEVMVMKHITELIQKQVVKKHSRALMFYLFLLIAATVLAWISQSLYVSLFIVVFLAALAVRLIQAVHELGQVKRFTQSLRGPQRLLYRQVDTTFFLEDRWISCAATRRCRCGSRRSCMLHVSCRSMPRVAGQP